MIKLLLKKVYTSSSSTGSERWHMRLGGGGSRGEVGLFLGSVCPRGASGQVIRKLADSTNVCLALVGRTPCWESADSWQASGPFLGEEREEDRSRVAYLCWALMSSQTCLVSGLTHTVLALLHLSQHTMTWKFGSSLVRSCFFKRLSSRLALEALDPGPQTWIIGARAGLDLG